jgi:glycosyltransferase involved in cell wall biosynthesis
VFLYEAMRAHGSFDPWLVAASGTAPHAGTPWSAVAADPQQLLFAGGAYDRFWGRLHDRRRTIETWRDLLDLVQPDVVHLHHVRDLGYDLLWQARNAFPRTPIVFTLHEYDAICLADGLLLRIPSRERCDAATPARCHACRPDRTAAHHFLRKRRVLAALDTVDRFLAPSRQLADRYIAWGLPAERIQVLENARAAFPAPGAPARSEGPPNRFGYFGQLAEVKGVLVLLRAARLLHERGIDVEVVIHGANLENQDPQFQEAFRRELAACPPTVALHPPYAPGDVDTLMRSVDWVVVPSVWWENSPLVIQEAFLNGRPVICSGIGGMAEKVRHDVDGLWFKVGDAGALAATMTAAAASRELWARLSGATRRPPTPVETVAAHEAIYRELRAGRRAQPAAGVPS